MGIMSPDSSSNSYPKSAFTKNMISQVPCCLKRRTGVCFFARRKRIYSISGSFPSEQLDRIKWIERPDPDEFKAAIRKYILWEKELVTNDSCWWLILRLYVLLPCGTTEMQNLHNIFMQGLHFLRVEY